MRVAFVLGSATVLAVGACSILNPLDDLAGSDAGSGSDTASDTIIDVQPIFDVPLPPSCKAQNLRCVPAPPAGWSLPFAFFAGATPPACPADAPLATLDAKDSLGAVPAAQCPACACTGTLGCGPATVTGFSASGCDDAGPCTGTYSSGVVTNNQCFGLSCNANQLHSVRVGSSAVTGTCSPQVANPTPTLPAVTWAGSFRGCRAPTLSRVDCAEGELCATKLPSPFGTKLCIVADGDLPCPTPYTESRRVGFTGTTDTRACGACTCGAPSGTCTAMANTDYGGGTGAGSCFTGLPPVAVPGCVETYPHQRVRLTATPPQPSAACAPGGGAPTGTVVPAKPVTICCEP